MQKASDGSTPIDKAPEKGIAAKAESGSSIKVVASFDLAANIIVINPAPNASPPRSPALSKINVDK